MTYGGPVIDVHTYVTQISVGADRPQGVDALRDLCAEAGVTRAGALSLEDPCDPRKGPPT